MPISLLLHFSGLELNAQYPEVAGKFVAVVPHQRVWLSIHWLPQAVLVPYQILYLWM
jgi:hypothetical protein